jgi:peptidoglycan hydrolase-like protein with peptidoglycan-binding domain
MRKGGFDPRQVGHYRTFQQQLNLFTSRYQEASQATFNGTPSQHRKTWNDALRHGYKSIYWVKKLINGRYPATAATPGQSNHGWGLALDIAEEYDTDTAPDPIRSQWVHWLVDNAHRYGISAELQSEPWHWRYVAGDRIPQAVLDFERGITVTPVEPSTPVLVFAYPGKPVKRGSKGVEVELVQAVVGATVDGDFGPATEKRVKSWQTANKLLADGIVGPVTWKKMFG